MALTTYKKKRDFKRTPEPSGKVKSTQQAALRFVVQKHHASHLHYDFRLEHKGVLVSWAVPKGPSLQAGEKRLAVAVEDHPYDYRTFEGIIPKGNYGAGTVMVWDEGFYFPVKEIGNKKAQEEEISRELERGTLELALVGHKLKGEFTLTRIRDEKNWLLIKRTDDYANREIEDEEISVKTGRTMEEIKKGITKIEDRKLSIEDPSSSPIIHHQSSSSKDSPFPHKIRPMLATLVDNPFDKRGWIFEIKWDGYRAIAEVNQGKVDLYSRNFQSFNERYKPIVESLQKIKHQAVFDGEVVALDREGKANFQMLQNYMKSGGQSLVYYIFDILYIDGKDLTGLPLIERKSILQKTLPNLPNIKFSSHQAERGIAFFAAAQKAGLEGIMAKDGESIYQVGIRSLKWLKIKTKLRQEVIIGGFTKPRGTRKQLGALVAGVYKNEELVYVGHVGGLADPEVIESVYRKLKPLERKTSPFTIPPKTNMPVTWVEPKVLCEVEFSGWTVDNRMRIPIFVGLRTDKDPKTVSVEQEKKTEKIIDTRTSESEGKQTNGELPKLSSTDTKVHFTNPNKVFWPEEGYTKGDVIEYYRKIAPVILPYLKDRPENLNRHPNGITGANFYQKDVKGQVPSWIQTVSIYSESNKKDIHYLVCNDLDTLLYTANLGCIEINPWHARIAHIDKPDYMVMDLDPEETSFENVIKVAQTIRALCEDLTVPTFPKTSGATGLHIYTPLGAHYDTEQVVQFAKLLSFFVRDKLPQITSMERSPQKRRGKVYLDFLQNRKGQTLSSVYSLRPKAHATVSTPLKWEEVKPGLSPQDFTIKNIFSRLDKVGDLWKGVLGKGFDMKKALARLKNS